MRFCVSNLIKQILTFYDNSNFVLFLFFSISAKRKLDFINFRFIFSISVPPRFSAFPPRFSAFSPKFPAFPPLFPAFPRLLPAFPLFRSPISHSGFYRYQIYSTELTQIESKMNNSYM